MWRKLSEWAYVEITIAAYIFVPEIRRLSDWALHTGSLNIFAAIPIAMLLPIVVFVYRRRGAFFRSPLKVFTALWVGGFIYAFIVGVAQRALLPGLFGLGSFPLPFVLAAWLVSRPESIQVAYERISRDLLVFGALAGVYGIFQYVVAPPWDTEWMQNITAESFGTPVPFGIRVFSVLNGPGVFANFLSAALVLCLPRLRLSKPFTILAMLLMIASLAITLVRSAWGTFAVGLIIMLALSPERRRFGGAVAVLGGITVVGGVSFFTFSSSDDVKATLNDRLSTLYNVQDDYSARDRQFTAMTAMQAAAAHPSGYGLGTTGLGSTLSDKQIATGGPTGVIDNGYISRFVEMGYVGSAVFALCQLYALMMTVRAYLAMRRMNGEAATIVASSIAIQVGLILSCVAGDSYYQIGSVMFALALGIGQLRASPDSAGEPERPRRSKPSRARATRFA